MLLYLHLWEGHRKHKYILIQNFENAQGTKAELVGKKNRCDSHTIREFKIFLMSTGYTILSGTQPTL